MKKIFIIEDDQSRINEFRKFYDSKFNLTIATSVDQAKSKFTSPNDYDAIFFDHDLGGLQMISSKEYNTGFTFAKWLLDKFEKVTFNQTTIVVHSLNPIGANNIYSFFKDWHPDAHKIPWYLLLNNALL